MKKIAFFFTKLFSLYQVGTINYAKKSGGIYVVWVGKYAWIFLKKIYGELYR